MNGAYPGLRSRCSLQPGLVQDGLSALGGETNQSGSYRAGFQPSEAALIDDYNSARYTNPSNYLDPAARETVPFALSAIFAVKSWF
jgi:hypothetical protein